MIDIRRLAQGTTLLLEGNCDIYELIVKDPDLGLIEITSNNPVLRHPVIGQLMNTIQWGGHLVVRFHNGHFYSAPISSASVRGPGWSYEVF